jgi:hypothetical protein
MKFNETSVLLLSVYRRSPVYRLAKKIKRILIFSSIISKKTRVYNFQLNSESLRLYRTDKFTENNVQLTES